MYLFRISEISGRKQNILYKSAACQWQKALLYFSSFHFQSALAGRDNLLSLYWIGWDRESSCITSCPAGYHTLPTDVVLCPADRVTETPQILFFSWYDTELNCPIYTNLFSGVSENSPPPSLALSAAFAFPSFMQET